MILYFLRKRADPTQKFLVQMRLKKSKAALYGKRSTNPEIDLIVLNDRIKSLQTKAAMLRK